MNGKLVYFNTETGEITESYNEALSWGEGVEVLVYVYEGGLTRYAYAFVNEE